MKLNLETILGIVTQVGAATPAFEALFGQVVGLFDDADQDTLKQAYAAARVASDAAHGTLQEELAERTGQ